MTLVLVLIGGCSYGALVTWISQQLRTDRAHDALLRRQYDPDPEWLTTCAPVRSFRCR